MNFFEKKFKKKKKTTAMDLKLTFCNFKSFMRFCLKTDWNRCNHNKPHFKQSDLNRGSGGAHFHSSVVIERRWNHVQFPLGLLQNFDYRSEIYFVECLERMIWIQQKNCIENWSPRDIEILFFKIISRTNSRWRAISWVFFFFFFFCEEEKWFCSSSSRRRRRRSRRSRNNGPVCMSCCSRRFSRCCCCCFLRSSIWWEEVPVLWLTGTTIDVEDYAIRIVSHRLLKHGSLLLVIAERWMRVTPLLL